MASTTDLAKRINDSVARVVKAAQRFEAVDSSDTTKRDQRLRVWIKAENALDTTIYRCLQQAVKRGGQKHVR